MTELFELQIHQFEYDGLPDTLPAEWLEFYMLINGKWLNDPEVTYLIKQLEKELKD